MTADDYKEVFDKLDPDLRIIHETIRKELTKAEWDKVISQLH